MKEGVDKFGRYFKRKGWINGEDEEGRIEGWEKREKVWGLSEGGVRVVVEFATAYAVTKALLPARLILSVWATPWFARISVIPITNRITRLFRRGNTGRVPKGTENTKQLKNHK